LQWRGRESDTLAADEAAAVVSAKAAVGPSTLKLLRAAVEARSKPSLLGRDCIGTLPFSHSFDLAR
jgi:hypothetical protein